MAESVPSTTKPESLKVADRLLDTVIRAGESRVTQIVAGLQIPIYAAFIHSAMNEGMSWWGAALHPVLNLSGGLDALLGSTETANQLVFAATLGELKTVGLAALLTVGTATVDRMGKITRGELPIVDPEGVVFLSAGLELPLAGVVGKTVLGQVDVSGGPKNLYFSALYGKESLKPQKPGGAFQKRHFISSADMELNVTDTDVLRPTGALTAKTVVLAAPNDRVLEDIAITIRQQRGDNARIIPIAQSMANFEAYSTLDLESGEEQILTEKPINPFRRLVEQIVNLTSSETQQVVVDNLVRGLPFNLQESRKKMILQKVEKLGGKQLKIFLNGSDGEEKIALLKSFGLEEIKDKIMSTELLDEADIVVSFGEGKVTDDVSVSEVSEQMKKRIFHEKFDILHIGIPFSMGNEDSVGAHAQGVFSLQRLMAEEITERVKDDLLREKTIQEKLKNLLQRVVGEVSGKRIRQVLS